MYHKNSVVIWVITKDEEMPILFLRGCMARGMTVEAWHEAAAFDSLMTTLLIRTALHLVCCLYRAAMRFSSAQRYARTTLFHTDSVR